MECLVGGTIIFKAETRIDTSKEYSKLCSSGHCRVHLQSRHYDLACVAIPVCKVKVLCEADSVIYVY